MATVKAPSCQACKVQLTQRLHPTQTQAEQGMWFDHPPQRGGLFGHTTSALIPTEALQAVYAAAAGKDRTS
jgi:hypothetical protein